MRDADERRRGSATLSHRDDEPLRAEVVDLHGHVRHARLERGELGLAVGLRLSKGGRRVRRERLVDEREVVLAAGDELAQGDLRARDHEHVRRRVHHALGAREEVERLGVALRGERVVRLRRRGARAGFVFCGGLGERRRRGREDHEHGERGDARAAARTKTLRHSAHPTFRGEVPSRSPRFAARRTNRPADTG